MGESLENLEKHTGALEAIVKDRERRIDAAACIIKVLHGKVNELTSKCAQLQSSLEQANNNINISKTVTHQKQ